MMQPTGALPLKRAVLTGLVILVSAGLTAGCSSVDLGDIDRTDDPRETMPGPGVLDNEQDGNLFTWNSEKPKPAAAAGSAASTPTDEKAEFEQFRKWDNLRTNEADSAEYQEFLQWLKYQKFKAGQ
jgi:hypothetical protein